MCAADLPPVRGTRSQRAASDGAAGSPAAAAAYSDVDAGSGGELSPKHVAAGLLSASERFPFPGPFGPEASPKTRMKHVMKWKEHHCYAGEYHNDDNLARQAFNTPYAALVLMSKWPRDRWDEFVNMGPREQEVELRNVVVESWRLEALNERRVAEANEKGLRR